MNFLLRKMMIMSLVGCSILLTACTVNENKIDEREQISQNFLREIYAADREKVEAYKQFKESMVKSVEVENNTGELKQINEGFIDDKVFEKMVDKEALNRLIANRELDRMLTISEINNTYYEIEDIQLSINQEGDNMIIYDFNVILKDTAELSNKHTLTGQLKLELIEDIYLITHTDLKYPSITKQN